MSNIPTKTRLAASEREIQGLRDRNVVLERLLDTSQSPQAGPSLETHSTVDKSLDAPLNSIRELDKLLDTFFDCIGALFYITDRDHADAIFKAICASDHVHVPVAKIGYNSNDLQLRTLVSEIAGMAAIGVVHFQLADPKHAPPPQVADDLYLIARNGLEAAIQYNPLRAMKLAALLAMYNIIVHATVALSYAGLFFPASMIKFVYASLRLNRSRLKPRP